MTALNAMVQRWTELHRTGAVDGPRGHCESLLQAALESGGVVPGPINGQTSDGYHTFDELYRHRMLLTAALFDAWYALDHDLVSPADPGEGFEPHKSRRHSDGTEPFGGGWFIVVAQLPAGQISYHYQLEHWGLFGIPERELPAPFDGHTAAEAADRLEQYLSH